MESTALVFFESLRGPSVSGVPTVTLTILPPCSLWLHPRWPQTAAGLSLSPHPLSSMLHLVQARRITVTKEQSLCQLQPAMLVGPESLYFFQASFSMNFSMECILNQKWGLFQDWALRPLPRAPKAGRWAALFLHRLLTWRSLLCRTAAALDPEPSAYPKQATRAVQRVELSTEGRVLLNAEGMWPAALARSWVTDEYARNQSGGLWNGQLRD